MIKQFKESLEKELGCEVRITIDIFDTCYREEANASTIAAKLKDMFEGILNKPKTVLEVSGDCKTRWLRVQGDYLPDGGAVVFLPEKEDMQ